MKCTHNNIEYEVKYTVIDRLHYHYDVCLVDPDGKEHDLDILPFYLQGKVLADIDECEVSGDIDRIYDEWKDR